MDSEIIHLQPSRSRDMFNQAMHTPEVELVAKRDKLNPELSGECTKPKHEPCVIFIFGHDCISFRIS